MSILHYTRSRKVILSCLSLGIFIVSCLSGTAQAQPAPLKVACLGDSITVGYGLSASDAYPVKLQTSLGIGFNVQNYGVSGVTAMIQSRNPDGGSYWATSAYQSAKNFAPNVIILKLGSNDAKTTNDTQRGVNNVNFVSDVEAAIDELRALPSLPTVFLCTPYYAKGNGFNISANTLNNSLAPLLHQIATRKNCTLIDLHALQSGNNTYYQAGDNIHPNAAGMTLIANEVSSILSDHYGQPVDGGFYTNSWIGTTFGTPAEHIAHTIDNLYVTPSGKVATITGWDEGGANVALYSATGSKVGVPPDSGTGSWGRDSGGAVFADDTYLYQSMSQKGGYTADDISYPVDPNVSWKCIRRFNQDGSSAPFSGGKGYDGAMLVINTDSSKTRPSGVVVYNNELFVSDPIAGEIKVYNATTMSSTPVRVFSIANPGLLDNDSLGFLWMLDTVQKKLIRFNTAGVIHSQSITFPAQVTPTGFCVDKVNDRIFVTNNGIDQNVLIYTNIYSTPTQTATFGNTGGINSGIAGAMAPLKFSEPHGVGIDSSGNIFVGNNGVNQGGGRLEKYNSSGTLQWQLNGLIFTAVGELNPVNESEFYSHEFKFNMNLANTAPGSEWSPAAMTLNKVKYPDDPRIFAPGEGNRIRSTAYVRNVGGKKLLYVTDMYGSFLAIYRFNAATDGETAIPSGLFDGAFPNETLWRDANGNGAKDSGETQSKVADNSYSQHTYPDANGGVWKANRENGVRYFPLQGFDTHGNPQYTYANSVSYALPELAADARRLDYDAANDVLYVVGASANGVLGGDWGVAGDLMVRYNNFLGVRTTAWSISLPFRAVSPNYENVKGFCEAGDYLFIAAYRFGRIYVHRKSDGSKVGEILPTAATDNVSGWSDIMNPIRATRRSNGEFLIFAEENGFGKIMMYRWKPTVVSTSPKLTGSVIGNLSESQKVYDTDTGSFPDSVLSEGWAGLDLGVGAFKQVTRIRYFPRVNFPERMVGSLIQGSDSPDFKNRVVTLHEITSTPPPGWTEVNIIASAKGFRYLRILLPTNSYNNVAEVEFHGENATQDLAAPAAPTSLLATPVLGFEESQIDLSWTDQSSNETYFLIERKQGVSGTWNEVAAVGSNVTSYRNVGLDPGTLYYFRVRAFNNFAGATNSAFTNEVGLSTAGNVSSPLLVRQALIGNLGNDSSQLDRVFDGNIGTYPDTSFSGGWAGLDLGAGAFKQVTKIRYFPRASLAGRMVGAKFQGSDSPDFRNRVVLLHEVTSTPPADWSAVTTIASTKGFRYLRILMSDNSFNNVNEVEFYGDNAVQDSIAPVAPTALSASPVSGNSESQIDLSWTDQSSNETYFLIERKLGVAGIWNEIAAVAANTVTYRNMELASGTLYYYRVSAFNNFAGGASSAFNNEVSLSTTVDTTLLAGTPIGTNQPDTSLNASKAFDGNTSTFFEAGGAGVWAGLDFGATGAKRISKIQYFPRDGFPNRMASGIFEGSNTADFSSGVFTLHQISGTPPAGWSQVTIIDTTAVFRYVRFRATLNNQWGGNPAEIKFFGAANVLGPISIPGGALVLSGNSATITLPTSVAGFSYSMFYSDTLQTGSWLPVSGNPKLGGGVLSWTHNTTGAPQRFYRMSAE